MITTRSGARASNDTTQVEENESPKVAKTIPRATSTHDISPEDAAASSHAAAKPSHNATADDVSKGKEIRLPPKEAKVRVPVQEIS
ncbi:hypothetical protein V6N13_139866 [Hibiscus sabdariffa]